MSPHRPRFSTRSERDPFPVGASGPGGPRLGARGSLALHQVPHRGEGYSGRPRAGRSGSIHAPRSRISATSRSSASSAGTFRSTHSCPT